MTDSRIQRALEIALERGEVGVQVAAYLGDDLIVDASIGLAEEGASRPAADALFPIFSVTKATVATALLLQEERGLLELDAPVARYWPEYAQNGKGGITLRHILTHRGGVPHVPADLTPDRLNEWDWIVSQLAAVSPLGPPGVQSVYHALSFGYILGEVLRRTDPKHRLPGAFIREELFEPVGADDFWVGLPPELEPRMAKLTWGQSPPGSHVPPSDLRTLMMPAAISGVPDVFNLPAMHQGCMPAANGVTSARSGAKFFSLLANGGTTGGRRLISEARLRDCLKPRENPMQVDDGIQMVTWIGVGGYWLGGKAPPADPVVGTSESILAHGGAGGSIAWADLDSRLSVMITHNRMFGAVPAERHPFVPLGNAVRAVAAEALAAGGKTRGSTAEFGGASA